MQRFNGANALANANGTGKTGWQDYNAATGQAGSIPNAATMNSWQEELAGFMEAMGLTLDGADNTQMQQAVAVAIATQMRGMFAPEPTIPASMVVNLTAGYVAAAGSVTQVIAQASPAFVAPVGNPRIDRIVINRATGALAVVGGAPAAAPVAPAVPATAVPVAQVALAPTSTAITAAMITDERDLPPLGLGTAAWLAASSGAAATLAAVSGAVTAGHLAKFADGAGTVAVGGVAGALANASPDGSSIIVTGGIASVPTATTAGAGILKLATAAMVGAGTDAAAAITSAALAAAMPGSFGGNGYQKLPNGLIFQWGSLTANTSGIAAITFPVTFPSGVLSLSALINSGSTTANYGMTWNGSTLTPSGVTFGVVANAAPTAASFFWFAIGH